MVERTVLITGISGFIAGHCAIELLRAGYRVRGTVRSLPRAGAVRATLERHADLSRLGFAAADLESDAGWDVAVAGCSDVLHVASPFPARDPYDEQVLIRPAVQGTLRVLRAARAAGVQRFVQTSSTIAVTAGHPRERTAPFTEADWTRVESPGVTAYAKSKTLAERAARDFVACDGQRLHFATVNPGFVLGPVLDADLGASAQIVQMLLRGKYPGTPRFSLPCVDVRDVARMHRLALETATPGGGRYLCVAESQWLNGVACAIRAGLGARARRVPTRVLPDLLVRLVAIFDKTARATVHELGREVRIDDSSTRSVLPMTYVPAAEAAVAMARSLVDLGLA